MVDSNTQITFANSTYTLLPNALKVTIFASDWPFQALSNSLQFVMNFGEVPLTNTECSNFTHDVDGSGNLRSVQYNVNGQTFTGKFLDNAQVDGTIRPVQISLSPEREVILSLSHFWSYAAIDPDFSIFLDTVRYDQCGNLIKNDGFHNKTVNKVAIAVAVTLGVVGIAAIITGVTLRKKNKKNAKKRLSRALENKEVKVREDSFPWMAKSPSSVPLQSSTSV